MSYIYILAHLAFIVLGVLFFFSFRGDLDRWFQSSPGENDNQLSCQSALWAIAAIALTNMADLPSKVAGYPQELTFYLKASPITCLSNVFASSTYITISVFTSGVTWKSAFDDALDQVSIHRFGLDGAANIMHRPVRWTLFVLGAVPQAVKLFACSGIPTTQLMAACYILDFIGDELILQYAQTRSNQPGGQLNYASRVETYLSSLVPPREYDVRPDLFMIIGAQLINQIWSATYIILLIWALPFHPDEIYRNLWQTGLLSCIIMLLWGLMWIPVQPARSPRLNEVQRRMEQDLFFLSGPLVMALSMCILMLIFVSIEDTWLAVVLRMIVPLLSQLSGLVYLVYVTITTMELDTDKTYPSVAIFVLSVLNLTCYYSLQYDASKTYRPPWTEWLG